MREDGADTTFRDQLDVNAKSTLMRGECKGDDKDLSNS